MDNNFNMPGIGKRMPYKTPEGVFDVIERNVISATGCESNHSHRLRAVSITLAAAASLAFLVVFAIHLKTSRTDSFADVQQAFERLDDADRSFLSEIYYEDTFINVNY